MSRTLSVLVIATLIGAFPPYRLFADDSPPTGRLVLDIPSLSTPLLDESDSEDTDLPATDPDGLDGQSSGASLESDRPSLEARDHHPVLPLVGEALRGRFADLFEGPGTEPVPAEEAVEELTTTIELPLVRNDKVESHIRFFQVAIRDRFEQWLLRLAHYKPWVETIFSEFNLPPDLVYLSLVESGFNPHAYSRARATGPWQFMKGTAQLYGLRVDAYVDERRDPIKSTVAAARYLRDLYDLFGTWPLAMAAYNAGEGKVMRALQKAGADSFWEIARTKHLKRETKEYVPRFMAATIIAKNPDQYGFIHEAPVPHQFDEVIVGRPIHLKAVASATGISLYELRRLNPELRLDVTPPGDARYHLKVPPGMAQSVSDVMDNIPTWKPSLNTVKQGKTRRDTVGSYRVRGGDTLWAIAKRFNLTVAQLKAQNRFAARGIKPGDVLTIRPIQ